MIKILKPDFVSTYRGLKIMANPDLHASVMSEIKKLNLSLDTKILVLGAGTGAFDRRLLDAGFTNITSVDINSGNYGIKDGSIKFLQADLNKDFYGSIGGKFNLIICLEIIEHLHNPFNFLENCSKLLDKGGLLILSTPNVHDGVSRVHNLIFGYPVLFLSSPEKYGHISPIFRKILEHYLELNNLKVINVVGVSGFFKYLTIYSFKSYLYYLIVFLVWLPLLPFMLLSPSNRLNGLLAIYIIGKR